MNYPGLSDARKLRREGLFESLRDETAAVKIQAARGCRILRAESMMKVMKIAIISTENDNLLTAEAHAFLPKLLKGLTDNGNQVNLFTKDAPAGDALDEATAQSNPLLHRSLWQLRGAVEENLHDSARWLNEFETDIYLIWNGDAAAWAVLPLLKPATATIAVGHADSEVFYAPARHYRSFLTRVIGMTPETCVGFVINCVIDKERVEWISYGELEGSSADAPEAELQTVVETYETCFEKAIADALAAPREISANFPPLLLNRWAAPSWFDRLKAKIMN